MQERNANQGEAARSYQTAGLTTDQLPVFYEQLKRKLTFPLSWTSGKYPDFQEWRQTARAKVLELIHHEPDATPFNPVVLEEVDRGTHLVRKVVFQLTAESRVLGLLGVPKGPGPFPAVLLLHDHGARFDIGKEKLIEPWGDHAKQQIAREWAAKYFSGDYVGDRLAAAGYVVLAVDALGWGDRGVVAFEAQQALGSNMLQLGTSLAGLMACEDMRAAEFLSVLPEVDTERIGVLGFSLGSYRAWMAAALSDKIKAGIAVGWMGPLHELLNPGKKVLRGQSAFHKIIPGLANYLDYPDVASIAAPKPLLIYHGELDLQNFTVPAAQAAFAKMRQVWDSQGTGAKLTTEIWPGLGHVFVRQQQDAAMQWLDRWLRKQE